LRREQVADGFPPVLGLGDYWIQTKLTVVVVARGQWSESEAPGLREM
jgi:hypothetical protein